MRLLIIIVVNQFIMHEGVGSSLGTHVVAVHKHVLQ